MPIFNARQYLQSAVASILEQDMRSFELLVVDDGSTDGGPEIVEGYCDDRIRVVRAGRIGLVGALNLGLHGSRGRFVARMDADDIARSDRLSTQVRYLDKNDDVALVCSDVRIIDADGKVQGFQRDSWGDRDELVKGLTYERQMKPIIHPSVMMRREVVGHLGGYRGYAAAEDRDFWLRSVGAFDIHRIGELLLDYRQHDGGVSREKMALQEVSSAMSVVNWLVHDQSGVDMFSDDRHLFDHARRLLESRLESEVRPGASSYRNAQQWIRSGKRVRGFLRLGCATVRYGAGALPDAARRRTHIVISDIVGQLTATLMERPQA